MTLALFAVGKTARLILGDSAEVLRALAPGSVDAVVTDPPSSIGFMGVEWDGDRGGRDAWVAWLRGIMELALVALKPGGHALAWALPKRSHWTALAVEDAGFEIRDIHHHIFGEGMPKSPAVLKPAVEHWIMGRKSFRGSLTACVAKHGTGGLNIEGCRIPHASEADRESAIVPQPDFTRVSGRATNLDASARNGEMFDPKGGRWPAHLSLDELGAAALDEQSGHLRAGNRPRVRAGMGFGSTSEGTGGPMVKMDAGGASRFFYVAKATDDERTASGQVDNDHETVKSIALMSWLVRLITPPGGTVLDPFAGSGTTGLACAAEGMSFIGVEQSPKHHETARRRLQLAYGEVST